MKYSEKTRFCCRIQIVQNLQKRVFVAEQQSYTNKGYSVVVEFFKKKTKNNNNYEGEQQFCRICVRVQKYHTYEGCLVHLA